MGTNVVNHDKLTQSWAVPSQTALAPRHIRRVLHAKDWGDGPRHNRLSKEKTGMDMEDPKKSAHYEVTSTNRRRWFWLSPVSRHTLRSTSRCGFVDAVHRCFLKFAYLVLSVRIKSSSNTTIVLYWLITRKDLLRSSVHPPVCLWSSKQRSKQTIRPRNKTRTLSLYIYIVISISLAW